MAGKGRASVNDMKRVEVLVLMEIDQQTEDNGGPYGFSRKTLAERVGVSPYRCLLYTSPSPRDRTRSRMPSSA